MIKRALLLLLVCFFASGMNADAWSASAPLNVSVDHGVSLTLSSPASSVFIANPDIADVQVMSPTTIMIFGKRTGETTFMASDSSGHPLAQRTVVVMQDLSDLRQELDAAIPGNKIQVQPLPNGIVLMGEAHDPASIADAYKLAQRYLPASGGDIINRIKVSGSNQINIRVRFAEVTRSEDNTLGIDWQSFGNIGGMLFGVGTGASVIGTDGALFPRPTNSSLATPNDAFGFSHQGKNLNINGMIDALARDGLVNILAEPNLTAMSGETAMFLAGGEIPIPIAQSSSGNNPVFTVEWKTYGISLEFTPTLVGSNRISLHVKPQVSQLTNVGAITLDGTNVPALLTRKAETTVEVGSGQSFAIAGLLDNSQSQTIDEFPILGDLPVIGALFRSNHFQNGQTELVVIITPYLVKPSNEQLALPMDNYSPPDDAERLIGLRYSSSDPNARPMSGEPTGKYVAPPAAAPVMPAPVAVPVAPVSSVPTPTSDAAPAAHAAPVPAKTVTTTTVTKTTSTASKPYVPPVASVPLNPKPAPAPLRPATDTSSGSAPAGPGGFTVE
ncbi:MAG TPA: type II and III secretion system protein family protein [Alphaproteobacteria bacterium]|nr:type II and III secretion system protein family protein [Alphaproteobacteria bacterium]